jgi:nitrous oxidase accessory protein NosD
MKIIRIICSAALLSILLVPAVHAQAASPLLVDDDKVQCPTAQFSTIQAAIDAASPGETIRVCKGTYHEQLTIQKSLTLAADNSVVLSPTGMTANATGLTQSDQIAAAVLVQNAAFVRISGFRIYGAENQISECSPRLIGVLFQDASGRIEHNAVRHFRLNSDPGCQSGNAIEVETSAGGNSIVTISDNSVDDYQKNGITANENGSSVTIDGNTVVGIGPTTGAAQNGIQIGFGASGSITNNDVSNHVWSPCVSTAQCSTDATGILVFESNNIRVSENSVGTNQIGIFTGGDNTRIASNRVSNSLVLDGVALASNNNIVELNHIAQSADAAVLIQGNHNNIVANEFLAAQIGLFITPGSTGTNHFGNQYFATVTGVFDDSAAPAAAAANQPLSNLATTNSVGDPGAGAARSNAKQQVSPSR